MSVSVAARCRSHTRYVDIWEAVVRLERVITSRAHEDPRYSVRNSVT